MTIALTDAAVKKRFKRIGKVDRADLWKELHDLGTFFALVGALSEALDVCEFAYSGLVPLPDKKDRTIHVNGDGVISAVCFQLDRPDLSKGRPAPKYVPPNADLGERVLALDRWVRHSLTVDVWSSQCDWDNPSEQLMPTARYRQARLLAQPQPDGEPAATEAESLALHKAILYGPEPSGMIPYHRLQAYLTATDIAARQDLTEEARHFLNRWYDYSADVGIHGFENDGTVEAAFALTTVAGLICGGALRHKSKLLPRTRQKLVTALISEWSTRLKEPEQPQPPRWKYTIAISYGQFYVEPRENDPLATYFQEPGEPEQAFSAFPRQVAFGTPDDADECTVEVEFRSKAPAVGRAVQAVAVPLSVEEPDGLYLRTVFDSGDKYRFDIPRGHYDVVARFFPARRKRKRDTCLNPWRAVLTFLPRGTVGAKCLKMPAEDLPADIVLHD